MAEKLRNWTLRDLHSLPDDGNKYELVRGELFVTPPPTDAHEEIVAVLASALEPYVRRERLGRIYRPRAVFRIHGSEAEPDLMVRAVPPKLPVEWEEAPLPLLVVEVLSESTRRRDLGPKRSFYTDSGIPEYWIVDAGSRTVRVVKPGDADAVHDTTLSWHPAGASAPLLVDLEALFRDALG